MSPTTRESGDGGSAATDVGNSSAGDRAAVDPERGAGTVLVLGVAAVVLLLGLALAALGSAQQARGTAQAAADLGALAAATALRDGLDPCVVAREAVARNHGTLAECTPGDGGVVSVTVTREAAMGLPGWAARDAVAASRAGPRPVPTAGEARPVAAGAAPQAPGGSG